MGRTGRAKGSHTSQTTAGNSSSSGVSSTNSGNSKQENISMAGLEVVNEESFQLRLEGMSCTDCLKERAKAQAKEPVRGRRRRRSARARLNSPIVVRLQDTIKVSVKNKWHNSPKSSDLESEDISSDDGSGSGGAGSGPHLSRHHHHHHHQPRKGHSHRAPTARAVGKAGGGTSDAGVSNSSSQFSSTKAACSSKPSNLAPGTPHWPSSLAAIRDDKNFNAFLSAIERVHQKEHQSSLPLQNLEEYMQLAGDKSVSLFLNNSVNCQGSISDKEPSSTSSGAGGLRHILELLPGSENIDLICNDLRSGTKSRSPSSAGSGSGSGGSGSIVGGDSDDPSDVDIEHSSVASSSESVESEESDLSSGGGSSESFFEEHLCSPDEHLCTEELDYLTQYTSGQHITRYDCAPYECPECIAYYAYAQYTNANLHLEAASKAAARAGAVDTKFSPEDQSDSDTERAPPCEVTITGKGKVTVSVANVFSKTKSHRRKVAFPNAVYLDLTDTDISLSIQYHPENPPSPAPHHHSPAAAREPQLHQLTGDWGLTWHPAWQPANSTAAAATAASAAAAGWGAMPFLMPYYMMVAVPWMPYLYPFPWFYTNPKPICVPRNLRCLNSQRLCMVPAHEIKNFTASQPPQRPWIPLAHPERNRPVAIYTVMCYNVLCDKYATRQLYGYCPSWALNWEYRKKGIIEEIRHYSADLITLQEVEGDQFYNFFQPELKRDGYDGIFSPKSRARTMQEVDRKHVDGCAIFFRTAKFSLIKEHLIEFNQLAMASADGSHDMLNRVMTKDNIGLAALLECKEGIWENGLPSEPQIRQPVLVATCHIHWDPEFCDVKLIQTMMLMSELRNIIEDTQTSFRPGSSVPDCNDIPLILCGDLNSLPESGVLEYLMTGKVHANHEDFKEMGYDTCLQKLSNSEHKDIFAHGFKLAQSYNKSIMGYTNYTFDFKGILDYIFSSRDHMRPLGLLGPLDSDWFRENKVLGCPHPHIPSDHLPLLVEYEMQPVPQTTSGPTTRPVGTMSMAARR